HISSAGAQATIPMSGTVSSGGALTLHASNNMDSTAKGEGTQTGAVFKIKGKGIPHLNGRGSGDEYMVVKVVTPSHLSEKEKELLKEFRKLRQKPGGKEGEQD
ncbi:MAG: DnaJ C-terminal domain-containing protein, partial [Dehalococcoidia bacterium]